MSVITRTAAIAALLFASACSGQPEVLEPDPTAATSTSRVPPSLPSQAKEATEEGAASFTAHWIEISDYAALTGDVEPLQRISASDCSGCTRFIDLYEQTYANGGAFEGGERRLLPPLDVSRLDDSTYDVTVNAEAAAGQFRRTANGETTKSKKETSRVTYTVGFEEGRWRMLFILLEEPS